MRVLWGDSTHRLARPSYHFLTLRARRAKIPLRRVASSRNFNPGVRVGGIPFLLPHHTPTMASRADMKAAAKWYDDIQLAAQSARNAAAASDVAKSRRAAASAAAQAASRGAAQATGEVSPALPDLPVSAWSAVVAKVASCRCARRRLAFQTCFTPFLSDLAGPWGPSASRNGCPGPQWLRQLIAPLWEAARRRRPPGPAPPVAPPVACCLPLDVFFWPDCLLSPLPVFVCAPFVIGERPLYTRRRITPST